jgi:hypothetical protein
MLWSEGQQRSKGECERTFVLFVFSLMDGDGCDGWAADAVDLGSAVGSSVLGPDLLCGRG